MHEFSVFEGNGLLTGRCHPRESEDPEMVERIFGRNVWILAFARMTSAGSER